MVSSPIKPIYFIRSCYFAPKYCDLVPREAQRPQSTRDQGCNVGHAKTDRSHRKRSLNACEEIPRLLAAGADRERVHLVSAVGCEDGKGRAQLTRNPGATTASRGAVHRSY